MRKIILSMQMSLDGFIEGPNGGMSWINSNEEVWSEMFKDLKSVDTFLLSSKMYPGYAGYWRSVLKDSSASKGDRDFAKLADKTPHIVFSRTMKSVDWANTRIADDAEKEIASLKKQEGKDIMMWGGATLASAFINRGWIDEFRITLVPVVLGGGKSLFGGITEQKKFRLVGTRPLKGGPVILNYLPG